MAKNGRELLDYIRLMAACGARRNEALALRWDDVSFERKQLTIAAWVGHRDGGVLIGKVYGHLANEHRKLMAGRVAFEPVLLDPPAKPQLAATM